MPDATALLLDYERLLDDLGKSLITATDPDAMRRRVAAVLADAVALGVLDVGWPDWEPGYPGPLDYVWCRDVLDELTEAKRDMLWSATGALIDVVRATGHEQTIAARDAAGQRVRDYFRARGNDAALAAWTPQAVKPDTVTAGQGQGEGADRRPVIADDVEQVAEILRTLKPSVQLAYASYVYAARKLRQAKPRDDDAWAYLEENGCDGIGPPGDKYILPNLGTWKRQLRAARKALGQQKNRPRHLLGTTRSIVRQADLDYDD